MRHYRVEAKCGHVGRHYYTVKNFYIKADDGKEAAAKVRYLPRVKHDRKDAILSVKAITQEEYSEGIKAQNADMYFKVHNSTEQRKLGAVNYAEVFHEPEPEERYRPKNRIYRDKLARIIRKDMEQQLSGEL